VRALLLPCIRSATTHTDLDPAEVAKFAAASGHDWWDPSGPAAPLHAMNPARVLFARRALCEAHG
jgi:2-polyprenyl-3-methyl-5-hydroxy-6-metoxy-1,4-benzoquinol methylase